jgi:hypothetical protein
MKQKQWYILLTPGILPPGTGFIMVYMFSPPELDESVKYENLSAKSTEHIFHRLVDEKRNLKKKLLSNQSTTREETCKD